MTSLCTAKDEPSASDRIPPIGSTIDSSGSRIEEMVRRHRAVDSDSYSNVTDPDVRGADCQAVSPGMEQKTTAVQPGPVSQASPDNYNY